MSGDEDTQEVSSDCTDATFYRNLLQHFQESFLLADLDGRILEVNSALCRMTGHKPHELIGCFLYILDPLSDGEDMHRLIQKTQEKGQLTHERYIQARNGRTLLVKVRALVESSAQGPRLGLFFFDATELDEGRQEDRELSELFRLITAHAQDVIMLTNPDGTIRYLSPSADRVFGQDTSSFVGTPREIFYEEDREVVRASLQKALAGEHGSDVEYRIVIGDGSLRWISHSWSPVVVEGRLVTVISIVRNIQERKELELKVMDSEERFRGVAEALQASLIIFGEQGIKYVNPFMCEMLGYTREELMQMSIFDLVHPDDRYIVEERARKRLAGEPVEDRYENRIFDREGREHWMSTSVKLINLQGEQVSLGLSFDITEEVKLREQLRTWGRHLVEMQDADRSQVTGYLHDNLGQQLILARMDLDTGGQALSNTCRQRALKRLDEAITSLRSLAHSLRPVALDDLGFVPAIRSLIEEVDQVADTRILFETNVTDDCSLSIDQRTALFRICQESINNVLRHAQATEMVISFQQSGDELVLHVQDNGQGFDAITVVSRFQHVGLITMRERAQSVGGTFSVHSQPGRGTTIQVSLPLPPKS